MTRFNHLRKTLALGAVLLACCAAAWAEGGTAQPSATNDPLRAVPADALFCIRVNKVNTTLGQVDQFLTGISPLGVSMPVRSQLGQLLGSPEATGVNMAGDFAAFGPLPGGEGPDPSRIGVLIPVSDYTAFLKNPNVAPPDAQGVSLVGPQGNQGIAAVQVGGYALFTKASNQPALLQMKKLISAPGTASLAQRLNPDDLKRSQGSAVWAYGNVQIANKLFGPMLQEKLKSLEEKQAQGPAGAPLGKIGPLLNSLLQETQSASLTLDPSATAVRLGVMVAAMPDTEMAKALTPAGAPQLPSNLLGYLQNGAIENFALSFNPVSLRSLVLRVFDLFAPMLAEQKVTQEDIAQMKQLLTDSVDSMGGTFALVYLPAPQGQPPFALREIVSVKDKQKFYQVLESSVKMMNEGAIANLCQALGCKMQMELKRNAETYKGVSIDAMRFALQPADASSQAGQMMKAMYGEGLNVRLAVVGNLALYAMSQAPDKDIRALIDQAQAGGPGQIASEVQAALQLLPDAKNSQWFGTYNLIRVLQMMGPAMPLPIGPVDVPTQSNVAFSGRIAGGSVRSEVAVPKQAVLEVMQAVMKGKAQQQGGQPGQTPVQPGQPQGQKQR